MHEYKVNILKVVDGDTVDIDIDLGFGIWLNDERVRIMGIDTPESRTRDKVEKQFGLAAKKRLKEMLDNKSILSAIENLDSDDAADLISDLEDEKILPPMRKLEDLKPVETKANEEGDEGVRRRRGSRSNTAALQKELEEAKKPKKRLSLREKIDYMANVEKL